VALGVLTLVAAAGRSGAAERAGDHPSAMFALIIGVNASLDADVRPLQEADDDAARDLDLFRALGARTYCSPTSTTNSRRLRSPMGAGAPPYGCKEQHSPVACPAGGDCLSGRMRSGWFAGAAGHDAGAGDAATGGLPVVAGAGASGRPAAPRDRRSGR